MNNEAVYVDFPEKDSENPDSGTVDSKAEGNESEIQQDSYNRLNGKDFIKENGSETSIFTAYNDDKQTGLSGPAIIASTPTSPASISISAVNAVGTTTSFATTVVEDAEQKKSLQIFDIPEPAKEQQQQNQEEPEEEQAAPEHSEEIAVVTSNSSDGFASVDEIILMETLVRYYGYLCFLINKAFVLFALSFFTGIFFVLFAYSFLSTAVIPVIHTKNPFLDPQADRRVAKI